MDREEYYRLLGYHYAKVHRPTWNGLGKRHIKGKSQGYGQILKKSFVKSQVPLERVFPPK